MRPSLAALVVVVVAGCAGTPERSTTPPVTASTGRPFTVHAVPHAFHEPWAMTFLPNGRALVTQRSGELLAVDTATGRRTRVAGTPPVAHGGQGGLGDVVLGPRFATDRTIYLSWAERGDGETSRAVVGSARLSPDAARLDGLHVVWRQDRAVHGQGHYGHRIAVTPDGRHLVITSGERQQLEPAQQPGTNLGRVVRTGLDGEDPTELSRGHRNPLGVAHDADGRLWVAEMGPKGGDELNLVLPGRNYGWPRVSNGSHYDGREIPDHSPGDGFEAPKVSWSPVISPSSLVVYSGSRFPQYRGDAFVGALSGQALVRVDLRGEQAREADRWGMGARIREVEQGPEGGLWLLEDGPEGRLLRLDPVR